MAESCETRVMFSPFFGIIIAVFLALCSQGSSAQRWSQEEFPNPTKDLEACGRRGKVSWVCDPDNVLSYETSNKVEELLYSIGKNTASGCSSDEEAGFQVGVAVLKKIRNVRLESVEETAEKFTKHLHDSWGVGHAGCDDGAMLLLSILDRRVYISTGKKAMELLSDNQINIIIEQIKPYLRRKDYDEAVKLAVVRIGEVFSRKVLERPPNYSVHTYMCILLIIVALLIVMVGVKQLYTLRKEEQERETREFAKTPENILSDKFCPICLEEFKLKKDFKLTCGHSFCTPCLTKWLDGRAECPLCRQLAVILEDVGGDFSPEGHSWLMMQHPSVIWQRNTMLTEMNRGSNSYKGSSYHGSFGRSHGFGGGCSAGGTGGGSWC